ncbi:hypothetical protein B0H14DRAFT_3887296 [Mycena olivaceomarginata]|nr:hypothetical protein B0H14DRAFT_3887296 [Mycena olivaceomarginata]
MKPSHISLKMMSMQTLLQARAEIDESLVDAVPEGGEGDAETETQSSEAATNSVLSNFLEYVKEQLQLEIDIHKRPLCYLRGDFYWRPPHPVFSLQREFGTNPDMVYWRDVFVWLPHLLPGAPERFKCSCGLPLSRKGFNDKPIARCAYISARGAISKLMMSQMANTFAARFGPAPFAALVSEIQYRSHADRELMYLAAAEFYGQSEVPPFSAFNDRNGYAGSPPSTPYLKALFTDYVSAHRIYAERDTASRTCTIGMGDHTFQLLKYMGDLKGTQIFNAAFTVLNEFEEFHAHSLTQTKSLDFVKDMFEGIHSPQLQACKPVAEGSLAEHPGYLYAVMDDNGTTKKINVTPSRSVVLISKVLVPGAIHRLHGQTMEWIFTHGAEAVVSTSQLLTRGKRPPISSGIISRAFGAPAPPNLSENVPAFIPSPPELHFEHWTENTAEEFDNDSDDESDDNDTFEFDEDSYPDQDFDEVPDIDEEYLFNTFKPVDEHTSVADLMEGVERTFTLMQQSAKLPTRHLVRDQTDERAVREVLEREGANWQYIKRAKSKALNKRIRRTIPPPSVLVLRLEALFKAYENIQCSAKKEGGSFFSDDAKDMIQRLLKLHEMAISQILLAFLSTTSWERIVMASICTALSEGQILSKAGSTWSFVGYLVLCEHRPSSLSAF